MLTKDTNIVLQVWGRYNRRAGLNLSVTAATALDLLDQARRLVTKVKSIPGWRHKWKLVCYYVDFSGVVYRTTQYMGLYVFLSLCNTIQINCLVLPKPFFEFLMSPKGFQFNQ